MTVYVAFFNFFRGYGQYTQLTDRQNRLLNPASRMRTRGNYRIVIQAAKAKRATMPHVLLLQHIACVMALERLLPSAHLSTAQLQVVHLFSEVSLVPEHIQSCVHLYGPYPSSGVGC